MRKQGKGEMSPKQHGLRNTSRLLGDIVAQPHSLLPGGATHISQGLLPLEAHWNVVHTSLQQLACCEVEQQLCPRCSRRAKGKGPHSLPHGSLACQVCKGEQ